MTLFPRGFILAASALVLLTSESAQIRTWSFSLPNGGLAISVYVHADHRIGFRIGPDAYGPVAPISEHVEPFKQVLTEMSALGLDPRKVDAIVMHDFGDDVRRALAYACADSPQCRPKTPVTMDMLQMMRDLLQQTGIFEPYNEAFKAYGLHVTVGGAEHIGLIPLSAVPPRHARDRANGKIRVFGHAMLSLRVAPIPAVRTGHGTEGQQSRE